MTRVIVANVDGGFESAMRVFRRQVQEAGLMRQMRQRAYFVPDAVRRKRKALLARKRRKK